MTMLFFLFVFYKTDFFFWNTVQQSRNTILHSGCHERVRGRPDTFLVVCLNDDLVGGELFQRMQTHLRADLVRGMTVVNVFETTTFADFPVTKKDFLNVLKLILLKNALHPYAISPLWANGSLSLILWYLNCINTSHQMKKINIPFRLKTLFIP